MLTKRIIPCLDIKDGMVVKGVNFQNLIEAGDPVQLAKEYSLAGADELVFLDITATLEHRRTFAQLVTKIAEQINIPFTVGGGIKSIEEAYILLKAGADKISVNSAAVKNPTLIKELVHEFGTQCIVIAIDTKFVKDTDKVFIHAGKKETELKTLDWAQQIEDLGTGEILLTSMDHDGTKNGFAHRITKLLNDHISIPIIASGGGGNCEHFYEIFKNADAALAASIFHFDEIPIESLKKFLYEKGVEIRL